MKRFKTPKLGSITLMGVDVPIEISTRKCKALNCAGAYDNSRILLKYSYDSEADFIDTLVHECFHACCEILGFQLNEHLEEVLAVNNARLFLAVLTKLSTVLG